MSTPMYLFTVSPRSTDPRTYWNGVTSMFELSERHGYSGVLIFTGNDTFVEPWVAAQHLLMTTRQLIPLVAVNPLYMHPFTVAKLVSSFAYTYGRATWLNLVTGAAVSYLKSMGDRSEHDTRYQRLAEYVQVLRGLWAESRVSLDGAFYQLDKVQLLPRIPAPLAPQLLLSGQSPAARAVARAQGARSMQMLPPGLLAGLTSDVAGIHFSVVTRSQEAEAWAAARRLYPTSPEAQQMLELSMANSDSHWKRRMIETATGDTAHAAGYWIEPFRNLHVDSPTFVGSHRQVASLLRALSEAGIDTVILDLPPQEEEVAEVSRAIALSGISVQRAGDTEAACAPQRLAGGSR